MAERVYPESQARDPRVLKGLQAYRDGAVGWRGGWVVAGSSGTLYRVSLTDETCECKDFEHRGQPCKHIYGVVVARAKTRLCAGCGEPTPSRELIELHGGDDPLGNHDNLTHFDGDLLCGECADAAGVIR